MEKITKKTAQIKLHKTKLSNIVVDSKGNLAYAQTPFKQILRCMLKDFPIMCWYMLIGMMLLFARSLWAIMHPAITVSNKADLLIYVFLMFVSFSVVAGLVGGSYYFAKSKLKSK
jgi:hypothetical protein